MATGVYGVQMFTIRREQGRLAEVAPLFRRFLDENPRDAAWRPGLAVIASDLGFAEAARKAFAEMAAAGFAFPADAKRSLTLSYLAEVCTRLGDALEAERLYEQLLPYRDNAILAPVATVCCGAAAPLSRHARQCDGRMDRRRRAFRSRARNGRAAARLAVARPYQARIRAGADRTGPRGRSGPGGSSLRRRGGKRRADRHAGAATEDPVTATLMLSCST